MRRNTTKNIFWRGGVKTLFIGFTVVLLLLPIQVARADSQPECEARGGSWELTTVGLLTTSGEHACYGFGGGLLAEGETSNNPIKDSGFDPLQTLAEWIANIVYYIMVGLFSTFAYIAAAFFSIAVAITLNSSAYALDFIATSWVVVRDLANMAFIFILIYIAFLVMLRAETAGTMKMLAGVIVVALIVNFSFFLTRVVIDGGNILAVQFYNLIEAPPISQNNSTNTGGIPVVTQFASGAGTLVGGAPTKDLTHAIMSGIDPTDLTSKNSFERYKQSPSSNFWYTLVSLSLIYFGAGIVFAILAGAFLFAGVKFMMRTVGLIFLIIASPLALIARAIGHPKTIGLFNKWLDGLVRWSLYPAIFLFIFWIITIFMKSLSAGNDGSFIGSIFPEDPTVLQNANFITIIGLAIANVGIKLGFVIAMLYIALSASDYITKEASGMAKSFQRWALSGISGGFAGALGRQTLGRAGRLASTSQNAAVQRTGAWLANRTYDLRKVPVIKQTTGGLATATEKLAGYGGLPVDYGKASDKRIGASSPEEYQHKKDLRRLGEIDKEYDEDRLIALKQREKDQNAKGLTLRLNEGEEMRKLEQLKKERGEVAERVKKFSAPQLDTFKGAEIEKVIKDITETQMKHIKESTKRSDQEKNKLEQSWHEKATDAPLRKANQQINLLRKINERLAKDSVQLATISSKIGTASTPKHTTVDSGLLDTMREEIETQRDQIRSEIGKKRGADTAAEQTKLRKFGEAIKSLDKLGEELKKVPSGAGGTTQAGTFDTSKVT